MIVNVSDTLQRWTNDVLLAGVHRVTIPVETKSGDEIDVPERFSMAYFFKARREVPVGSLESFIDGEPQSRKYSEMTALEFQKCNNKKMYAN